MPTKIVKWACNTCHHEHHSRESAIECEFIGVPNFSFKVGDVFLKNNTNARSVEIVIERAYVSYNDQGKNKVVGTTHVAKYDVVYMTGRVSSLSEETILKNLQKGTWIRRDS